MLALLNRDPCESFADGKLIDELSPEVIFPELGAPKATDLVEELLGIPELESAKALVFKSPDGMMVVETSDTLADGSGEAPNLKAGSPETLGASAAPNMMPLEVVELMLPVPDGI